MLKSNRTGTCNTKPSLVTVDYTAGSFFTTGVFKNIGKTQGEKNISQNEIRIRGKE